MDACERHAIAGPFENASDSLKGKEPNARLSTGGGPKVQQGAEEKRHIPVKGNGANFANTLGKYRRIQAPNVKS